MCDTRQLRSALDAWRQGAPDALLRALGYEPIGLRVPGDAHREFGLDPGLVDARLELAARVGTFTVFRLRLPSLHPESITRVARSLYSHNPVRRALLIFEAPGDRRVVFASWGLGPGPLRLRKLWVDLVDPRPFELDILAALTADAGATASEIALEHARALDRERVTRRFFSEFRRQQASLAAALSGAPGASESDRLELALVILGRLLFIYFVQRKGWLDRDTGYLRSLYENALAAGVPFYRRRLIPLFFSALNRPRHLRGRRARELGDLPYLNGGLFQRDPLERVHGRLDVPDAAFGPVIYDLFDRYQFTLREDQSIDQDVAIDPEMLGKVFEGLMAGSARVSTGAFYTPRPLVDRLVNDALHGCLALGDPDLGPPLQRWLRGEAVSFDPALRARLSERLWGLRVLDPAVGSGAFLLAVLQRLERLHDALGEGTIPPLERFQRRSEIIRRNLYGVDINGAAVRLCELRLWLALIVDLETDSPADVPPLPNLDINIRQGDALLDPLDFVGGIGDHTDANLIGRWQRAARRLSERRRRYFNASGPGKGRSAKALRRAERALALEFLARLAARADDRRRDLQAIASGPDLFGRRRGLERRGRRALREVEQRRERLGHLISRVREADELPFFSFPIHFADPERPYRGFDLIIGNPPWIRAHRWAPGTRARLRERFRFLRRAGWRRGARMAGAGRGFGAQLDLSALFLERALELASPDGVIGFVLPSKLARSLYGSAARAHLAGRTRLLRLEDWSLAPGRLFAATTYPLTIVLRPGESAAGLPVAIRIHTRGEAPLEFHLRQDRLSLLSGDPESPWALAPEPVRRGMARMASAPALGTRESLRPRRGIVTGANDVFIGEVAGPGSQPELIRTRLGDREHELERSRLRPILRGEDISAWRFAARRAVVWTHDDRGRPLARLPPATAAYLEPHLPALRRRSDLRASAPVWSLFRTRPESWGLRVVWRDIAAAPAAAVVPPAVEFLGQRVPVIGLNTVYAIPTASADDAHMLAALLNSRIAGAFLRAIAPRAAGGRFRFLGWTVALLPVPTRPPLVIRADLARLGRKAHRDGELARADRAELERAVARLYGLTSDQTEALHSFTADLEAATV